MLTVGQKVRANQITGDHEAEIVEVRMSEDIPHVPGYMIKMTRMPEGVEISIDEAPVFGPIPEDHLVPVEGV